MRPTTISVGPLVTAAANNICLTQTPSGAGALTLNGSLVVSGVAILDVARQVLFTFAANETGHSFVVTGTSWAGDAISETVAGTAAGTVPTVLSYKTVTSITISAAATGAMTVGTNAVASSQWLRLDEWAPAPTSIQCTVTGTVNYSVQGTLQDPNSPTNPVLPALVTWLDSPDPNVVGATTSQGSYYVNQPLWVRVLLNSGSGSVSAVVAQNGVNPR